MKKLFLFCFLVIPYWVNAQCDGVDFTYNVGGDSVFTKAYQADSSIVGNYFWYHNDLFLGTGSSVLFAIAPGDVKIDLFLLLIRVIHAVYPNLFIMKVIHLLTVVFSHLFIV